MKKQKKREARKRMEKRRERRRKRGHSGGWHADGSAEGHLDLRTWATDPLAMAVSGRISVMTLVNMRSGSWLIGTVAGLLDGGYLGSREIRIRKEMSPEEMARLFFRDAFDEWGAYLRPAPVTLASRLVWGAMAYSSSRGMVSIDGLDALPAMGYLPPPPGTVQSWSVDFVRRFGKCQIQIGDRVAAELAEIGDMLEGDDASDEEPDEQSGTSLGVQSALDRVLEDVLSDLLIISYAETETPLSMRAEIERHPGEFVYAGEGSVRDCIYHWKVSPSSSSSPSRIVSLEEPRTRGVVRLLGHGCAEIACLDPASAAALMMRLKDLVPSLHLRHCHWERAGVYFSNSLGESLVEPLQVECGVPQPVRTWNMR